MINKINQNSLQHQQNILDLIHENKILRKEIRVSREAAEITASLVVKQFEETEKILRRFQAANAQRRAVLNSAAYISIIATDTSGIIKSFNTGAENLLGYKAEEVIGKETPEIFLLESVLNSRGETLSAEQGHRISISNSGITDILFQYALQDSSEQLEWIYVRKDGTRFPVNMTINALREPDGKVSGMLCIANDISERKKAEIILKKANDELERRVQQRTKELAKANQELQIEIRERRQVEEALRDSEEKYRSIFENAAEGIFQTTPDGKLITANPAMAKILGYESVEEIISKMTDLGKQLYVKPERRNEFKQQMEQNGNVQNFEAEFFRKDGDIIHVCLNGHLVHDEDKGLFYYEGMLEDITQRKRSEELKIAKEAAEAATRAKSNFLANMSHEIRTPMNAIIGLTELALKTQLSSKQHDYLSKIHLSGHSLLGIINDILDFSKIEAGKLELEYADFNLNEVMNNLSDIFSSKIAEKGIEMVISVADNIPNILVGDSLRLSQILINLINNALKFTDSGEVVIKASLLKQDETSVRIRFEVADTGIGISKEYLPDLFTSFTQADSSTTRKYGGTGLGLTICRQLVQMMHGEIWAESEIDKGSKFYFTSEFGVGIDHETVEKHPPFDIQGLKILIVDNNATAREIYTEILNSFKYQASSVDSGEKAITELKKAYSDNNPYDLVLTDWRMPEMDGIETLKNIRNCNGLSDIPVIMMTAFGREEVMKSAKDAGANAFLIKPVKQSLLFDTILNIFDNSDKPAGISKFSEIQIPTSDNIKKIHGSRILLAEDNVINQQVAMEILNEAGLVVDVVSNGRQALESVLEFKYDAVLMDIQMPEMDGYETAREIRDYKRSVPIIAMTAHAMKGDREKCLQAGMDDYIAKPINSKQLFSILSKWINIQNDSILNINQENIKTDSLINENLPGIDIKAGLKRIKNEKVFKKLLIEFAQNHGNDLTKIKKAIKNGRKESAYKLVHALKGVAGNLSAKKLYDISLTFEQEICNDSKNIKNLINDLENALTQVIQSANILKSRYKDEIIIDEASQSNKADFDNEKINCLIHKLIQLLKRNDLEAERCCDELKTYLSGSKFYNNIAKISLNVENLDFNKALKKLIRLENNFKNSLTRGIDE